jgi:hypothetical protein
MMGHKTVEPKLYLSFSLDAAVPANHLVRRLSAGHRDEAFRLVGPLGILAGQARLRAAGHPLRSITVRAGPITNGRNP